MTDTTRPVRETTLHGDLKPKPEVRRLNPLALYIGGIVALVILLAVFGFLGSPTQQPAQAQAAQSPRPTTPPMGDLIRQAMQARPSDATPRPTPPNYLLMQANRAPGQLQPIPGAGDALPPGTPTDPYQRALLERQLQQPPAPGPPGPRPYSGGASPGPSREARARTSSLLAASFRNDQRHLASDSANANPGAAAALGISEDQRQIFDLLRTLRGGATSPGTALPPAFIGAPAVAAPESDDFSPGFTEPHYQQLAELALPISPFVLHQGSAIPATLLTGVNSDLAGQTVAVIRRPVYDTITGQYVLIPQGARLIGEYDSRIAVGQNRLLTAWTRIIFPDGRSLSLGGFPGADIAGNVGLTDKVNHHFGRVFGGALLLSVFSAAAQLSQPANQRIFDPASNAQIAAGAAGTELSQTAAALIERNLSIKPTILLRPGTLFDVQVTRDLIFAAPYEPLAVH